MRLVPCAAVLFLVSGPATVFAAAHESERLPKEPPPLGSSGGRIPPVPPLPAGATPSAGPIFGSPLFQIPGPAEPAPLRTAEILRLEIPSQDGAPAFWRPSSRTRPSPLRLLRDLAANLHKRLWSAKALEELEAEGREQGLVFTPPGAINVTAALLNRLKAVQEGTAGSLPAEAAEYDYDHVPGFSWDALSNYFGPNMERLQAHGLNVEFIETEPLGPELPDAPKIKAAIERGPKQKIVIGHSHGGNKIIRALTVFPELQKRVDFFVPIQTPYAGTDVADHFHENPTQRMAAMALTRLLTRILNPGRKRHGLLVSHQDTIRELSRAERASLAFKPPPLDPAIKVLSVVSRVSEAARIRLLLFITASFAKSLSSGLDSDGIVVPEFGVIPGSFYALLNNVGHIDTIADPKTWKYHALGVRGDEPTFAADLHEAIVRLLLELKALDRTASTKPPVRH